MNALSRFGDFKRPEHAGDPFVRMPAFIEDLRGGVNVRGIKIADPKASQ